MGMVEVVVVAVAVGMAGMVGIYLRSSFEVTRSHFLKLPTSTYVYPICLSKQIEVELHVIYCLSI